MQIYLDSNRGPGKGYMYTLGEDKNFNVFDLSEKKLLSNTGVSNSRPTVMAIDGPRGVAYLANRRAGIVVFDLTTIEVSCLS